MAKAITLVGEVAVPVLDLATNWVQTLSDYDVLFAKVITKKWAKDHMPVLSRHSHDPARFTTYKSSHALVPTPAPVQDDHILFTEFSLGQPGGRSVLHGQCAWGTTTKQTASGVRITCSRCNARCTVPQFMTDPTTPLGAQGLVAIKYPPDEYIAEWRIPKEDDASQSTLPHDVATPSPGPPLPFHKVKRLRTTQPRPAEIITRSKSLPSSTPPPIITPTPTAPLPPRAIKPLTIRLTRPTAVTQAISLPSSTTITPRSSSSSLYTPVSQVLLNALPTVSSAAGEHDSTAEIPPQSLQKSSGHQKRTFAEIANALLQPQQKTKNNEK